MQAVVYDQALEPARRSGRRGLDDHDLPDVAPVDRLDGDGVCHGVTAAHDGAASWPRDVDQRAGEDEIRERDVVGGAL